jgi:hypothetical protein
MPATSQKICGMVCHTAAQHVHMSTKIFLKATHFAAEAIPAHQARYTTFPTG